MKSKKDKAFDKRVESENECCEHCCESGDACECSEDVKPELDSEETQESSTESKVEEDDLEAQWEDKYLRLYAEYDNYRKRTAREKRALYDDSVSDVVRSWLPVLDNLERAEKAAEQVSNEEVKTVAEGLKLIQEQANEVLASLGVERIEALGSSFDPELHEAVLHVEDESLGENEVAEVFQTGYRRGERVIRHSVVKVAN
ncbi:MAG: nucleotide exchange factor GrpE [Eubacteriales bacterium]|nr:nucleotide exchange factor GrpE [Eubacteriales bacterium]